MDNETEKILSDAEKIRYTLETEGWAIMAKRLDDLIADVCDIRTLKDTPNQDRTSELQRRIDSVALIEHWLNVIKGEVDAAKDIAFNRVITKSHISILRTQ